MSNVSLRVVVFAALLGVAAAYCAVVTLDTAYCRSACDAPDDGIITLHLTGTWGAEGMMLKVVGCIKNFTDLILRHLRT